MRSAGVVVVVGVFSLAKDMLLLYHIVKVDSVVQTTTKTLSGGQKTWLRVRTFPSVRGRWVHARGEAGNRCSQETRHGCSHIGDPVYTANAVERNRWLTRKKNPDDSVLVETLPQAEVLRRVRVLTRTAAGTQLAQLLDQC